MIAPGTSKGTIKPASVPSAYLHPFMEAISGIEVRASGFTAPEMPRSTEEDRRLPLLASMRESRARAAASIVQSDDERSSTATNGA